MSKRGLFGALLVVAVLAFSSGALGASEYWKLSGTKLYYSSGNVGIGTSSPGVRLDVAGTLDASGSPNTGIVEIGGALRLDKNEIITNTNTVLYLQHKNNGDLRVDDKTLMVDASTNRVGIGTTSPGAILDIAGTADASGSTNTGILEIGGALRFDANEIITNTDSVLYVQHNNNGDLRVDNTTLMVDASTDRVGIGTTTPGTTLDVNGDLRVNGVIQANADGDVIIKLGN